MPDTFLGLFRFCFMAGWPARHKAAQPFGLAIDDAEVAIGKADQPIAGLGFGDADRLARQCIAEKDQIAAPFDLAVGASSSRTRLLSITSILRMHATSATLARLPLADSRR